MKTPLKTLLFATPLFVGGLELGLRLTGYEFPTLGMPDRELGWSLRPGAKGLVRQENREGVFVTINNDGLRDREHTIQKPASTLRIAVLGDSLCEATEVRLEKTFWAIAEQELAVCARSRGLKVEFINFGVAGYGTAQELIMLRTRVWKYQPDLVLLAFSGSDVSENFRPLSGQPLAPYYIYQGDALVLDDSFRSRVKYEHLRNLKAFFSQRLRILQLGEALVHRTSPQPAPPDYRLYSVPSDPAWEEAWSVTEKLISMIQEEASEHGAQLWIATTSNDIQVHPDPRKREALAKKLGLSDLFYPERRIRTMAAQEGIPVITLAEEMARYAEHNEINLHGFQPMTGYGHWNEDGHRVAAQIIASRLCGELGWASESQRRGSGSSLISTRRCRDGHHPWTFFSPLVAQDHSCQGSFSDR